MASLPGGGCQQDKAWIPSDLVTYLSRAKMADPEAIGELELEVKQRLYNLTIPELKNMAHELAICTMPEDNTRIKLSRTLEKHLQECLEDEEQVTARLTNMLTAIAQVRKASEDLVSQSSDVSAAVPPMQKPAVPKISFRRDFVVTGSIHGSKGISYSNVCRQIDIAMEKGYSESEIVHAIVHAVHSSQQLHSYLERRVALGLTVSDLKALLLQCYRKKSANELYRELCEGSQRQEEVTLDFVLRMLDLGHQVVTSSLEEGSDFKYDATLVRRMTFQSIQIGLRDECISQDLKVTLKANPTEEQLIALVNRSVTSFEERKKVHSNARAVTQKVKTHSVEAVPEEAEVDTAPLTKMFADLRSELKADIAALFKEKEVPNGRERDNERKPRRKSGCPNCRKHQRGELCDHCFYCGSGEHFMRGCKAKRNQQGNGNGSSTLRD